MQILGGNVSCPGQSFARGGITAEEGISVSYPSSRAISLDRETTVASVAETLRLLSSGAGCAIILALQEGPLRTKVLTDRIQGYTPRTIYRYLAKLADLGLVEREQGTSGVVHTLREGGGVELGALIDRFAAASKTLLPNGQVKPEAWSSLGLLADLWEAGVVEELSRGPRSATELAQGLDALSYHQLHRRVSRFRTSGFFEAAAVGPDRQRRYALTRRARRAMGLVAGIGRWRGGLAAGEMATVMRTALPLAAATTGAGSEVRVLIEDPGEGAAELSLDVDVGDADAPWASGSVHEWLAVLLDGAAPNDSGEPAEAIEDLFASLYEQLWTPSPF